MQHTVTKECNHRDIIGADLNQLVNQIRIQFALSGISEQESNQLLVNLIESVNKEEFLAQVNNKLKHKIKDFKLQILNTELSWILRKENFRWSFEAFKMYNIRSEEIIPEISEAS